MKLKVYYVHIDRDVDAVDADMCPITENEMVYEDLFLDYDEAIEKAIRVYDDTPVNRTVRNVHAVVDAIYVTDTGSHYSGKCFNQYKKR